MTIQERHYVKFDVDSKNLDEIVGDLFCDDDVNGLKVFTGNSSSSPWVEFWCETLESVCRCKERFNINPLFNSK